MARFSIAQHAVSWAHTLWDKFISPGDQVVDATCGNGHDTSYLAQAVLTGEQGRVWAIDLQQRAIDTTAQLLKESLTEAQLQRVDLVQGSHAPLPDAIEPESIQLIVYNLGYLPGADKTLTTFKESTLHSLQQALTLVKPGGAISVTCYPGHPEGKIEQEAVLEWASTLNPHTWCVLHHTWYNRNNAPSLLLIQKAM